MFRYLLTSFVAMFLSRLSKYLLKTFFKIIHLVLADVFQIR